MAQNQPPSLPPSHPAPYRHLGNTSNDRLVKAQMGIALVAGLVMVAVPLYLCKRPAAEYLAEREARKAASAEASAALSPLAVPSGSAAGTHGGPGTVGLVGSGAAGKGAGGNVVLGDPKLVKCTKNDKGKVPPEQCDRQPFFEEALVRAIRDNTSCVPSSAGGTINFLLDVDHKAKKVHAWAGKSGTMKRKARKEALSCVTRALPTPDWAQLPHQNQKYQISVMATYPDPVDSKKSGSGSNSL
jgi:hypothetical protein